MKVAIASIFLALSLVIIGSIPFALIWTLEVLFCIPARYTFETWVASLAFLVLVGGLKFK